MIERKLGLLYNILMGVSLKIYQRLICRVDPKETKTNVVFIFMTEKNRPSLCRFDLWDSKQCLVGPKEIKMTLFKPPPFGFL